MFLPRLASIHLFLDFLHNSYLYARKTPQLQFPAFLSYYTVYPSKSILWVQKEIIWSMGNGKDKSKAFIKSQREVEAIRKVELLDATEQKSKLKGTYLFWIYR